MGISRRTVSLLALVFLALVSAVPLLAQLAISNSNSESPSVLQIQPNQGLADSILNGHYAFTFSGYKNGNPIIMAGSFVADGHGTLTSGVLDVNDGSGEPISNHNVLPQTLVSGSVYSLTGSLGSMTLLTSAGPYNFKIVVSPNSCAPNAQFLSTCGHLIQSDRSHPQRYGSGVIKVQNPQYFSITSFFPGNFALQALGTDPAGKRYAAAGALGTNSSTLVDIDCSDDNGGNGWGLASCPLDINDHGHTVGDPIKGTFAATIDQNTGRGPFVNLSFQADPYRICPGVGGGPYCSYAYYVIDKQQAIMISANPVSQPSNLVLWWLVRQSPPPGGWTLSALDGASVMELSALDPNNGYPVPDVTAGVFSSDSNGNASFSSDENDGGSLRQQQASQGTYSIDSSGQKTGRATLQGFSTMFGGAPPVIYFSSANTGFLVGTDPKVTSGVLEPQIGGPFSNNSLIQTYAGGSTSPFSPAVTNSVTALFADGSGSGSANQFTSGPNGPGGPTLSILTYQVDSTGRATIQQGTNLYGIAYVVSPTKVVLIPGGNAPALDVFASGPSN